MKRRSASAAATPRRAPRGTTGFAVGEHILLGLGFGDHGVVGASAAALAGDVIAGIYA